MSLPTINIFARSLAPVNLGDLKPVRIFELPKPLTIAVADLQNGVLPSQVYLYNYPFENDRDWKKIKSEPNFVCNRPIY